MQPSKLGVSCRWLSSCLLTKALSVLLDHQLSPSSQYLRIPALLATHCDAKLFWILATDVAIDAQFGCSKTGQQVSALSQSVQQRIPDALGK